MGIAAVYGKPGKGKSSFATYYGLYLANRYRKCLVSNFLFNPIKVAHYCKLMGFSWLLENIDKGIIHFIPSDSDLTSILSIPDSVVLLDEAAIWLPARGSTQNTPKELLKDLCQIRHESQYLLYIAQSETQVDSALRNLCEIVYWCNGTSVWCDKLRNEKLLFKTIHQFTTDCYQQYMSDPKLRKNPIKTKILATKTWSGFLTASDKFVFELYDSFNRVEAESQRVDTFKGSLLRYVFPDTQVFPPSNSEKKKFPVIKGRNPFKSHKFSGLVSWLFTHSPAATLPKILEWDKRLSNFQGLSKLEQRIILSVFAYLFFFFIGLVF